MQTNEIKNVIVHYHRSTNGALTEVERVATGGAGSGVYKPISNQDSARRTPLKGLPALSSRRIGVYSSQPMAATIRSLVSGSRVSRGTIRASATTRTPWILSRGGDRRYVNRMPSGSLILIRHCETIANRQPRRPSVSLPIGNRIAWLYDDEARPRRIGEFRQPLDGSCSPRSHRHPE
jgi:hypothetical protein